MNRNRLISSLTCIVLFATMIPQFAFGQTVSKAEETQRLSVEAAISLAKANSMSLRQLTIAKDKAMKGYSNAENGGATARNMLDAYNSYQKLDENGAKDALAKAALEQYRAMFGGAPSLSFDQIYENFIVPSEVVPYQVYVQYQNVKIDEPVAVSNLEYQTMQLYYGILSYQHSIRLMNDSLKIANDKLSEMEIRYKVGQVSKSAVEIEKINYQKSISEYEKSKKDLTILQEQFNLLIGKPAGTQIELVDPGLLKVKAPVTYDQLLKNAMANRNELKKSQLQLDSLTYEIKAMSQYLKDPKHDKRVDADQRLLNAKIAHKNLERTIRIEVIETYNSFKQAELQLSLNLKKIAESEKQLSKIKQMYKAGYVKKLDVFSVELQLQNSKLSYETAVYNYNKQVDALSRVALHAIN